MSIWSTCNTCYTSSREIYGLSMLNLHPNTLSTRFHTTRTNVGVDVLWIIIAVGDKCFSYFDVTKFLSFFFEVNLNSFFCLTFLVWIKISSTKAISKAMIKPILCTRIFYYGFKWLQNSQYFLIIQYTSRCYNLYSPY